MLNNALAYLIDVCFGLLTYTLLLRLVMQIMRAPFRNPLGQAVMALTDWIVKPLRKVLPFVLVADHRPARAPDPQRMFAAARPAPAQQAALF